MTPTKDPFGITITNTETGQPSVYTGVAATLAIGVTNNTGAAIALNSGSSAFSVYLQSKGQNFFDVKKLQGITLNPCPWTRKWDDALSAITITCQQAGTWADGQTLTFTLANVISSQSSGKPSTVTLLPSDLGDDAPSSVLTYLAVMDPPKPGNLQLPEVLEATLENQGTVYCSPSGDDPLGNILYLTLKNTGTTSLATGSQNSGNPQVTVWFVYGSTSGALAPADYDPKTGAPVGSAWGITSDIVSAPKHLPWTSADPHYDPQERKPPQWTLAPSPANNTLLGPAGSDQANVTFSFSNVVSFTPRGHTQMFVHCTGFKQDEQTAYDDHLFVLDIGKLDPPLTRGVLDFFGPQPVIPILDPNAPVTIPLLWTMFEVDSVRLISSPPVVTPAGKWNGPEKKYGSPPPMPLDHDGVTVTLQRPGTRDHVAFTLQALDGKGDLLNSKPFPVDLPAYPAAPPAHADLVFLKIWNVTNPANELELHVSDGASGFQKPLADVTGWVPADRGQDGTWTSAHIFRSGTPDQRRDLVYIHTRNTPSGHVQISYVLTNLRSVAGPITSPVFDETLARKGTWLVASMAAPPNWGLEPELVLIQTADTPSGHIEIRADNPDKVGKSPVPAVGPWTSAYPISDGPNGTWLIADMDGRATPPPDLVFIQSAATERGKVVLSYATGASGYQSLSPNTWVTGFDTYNAADGTWLLADMNGDGHLDLVFVQTANTNSGRVEIYYALYADGYQNVAGGHTQFPIAEGPNGTWQVYKYV